MAKIRHIAYWAQDVEAMSKFFIEGLEMRFVQRRSTGAIDLTDGAINITLLPHSMPRSDGKPPSLGIDHIGFTVENEEDARRLIEAAGAAELHAVGVPGAINYEKKFQGPEGIVVDLGHWAGAAPVGETETAQPASHH
ncbi:MAG: lactoylglutathione lyase family protein [Chloroflexi bacterium]|nr:lactoylglutathione lyase family protein [Chloroflexota bacterium]